MIRCVAVWFAGAASVRCSRLVAFVVCLLLSWLFTFLVWFALRWLWGGCVCLFDFLCRWGSVGV